MSTTKKEIQIKKVTKEQLVKTLMQLITPTPATFLARTEVKMNKKDKDKNINPYHGLVQKEQRSNVFINFNYANSVNKARIKEGKEADFVPKERPWGQKIPGTPLVLHEGNYYLEARFLDNEPAVTYYKENKIIEKAEIASYLPPEKEATSTKSSQDLENDVVIRTFKIENIKEIQFGGVKYILK